MRRFFVEPRAITGDHAFISGTDYEHAVKVLRMHPGDGVTLCDGEGRDYSAVIVSDEGDRLLLSLSEAQRSVSEPPYSVTLFQGVPKGDRFDYTVQKAAELGVSEIVPVITGRSVADGSGIAKRIDRYSRIALEAAKQSGRGLVPRVRAPIDMDGIDISGFDLALVPYEEEHGTLLGDIIRGRRVPGSIAIVIGPEGGFEPNEVEMLVGQGARRLSLGPRILRTETAGPAVLAMLMYEFEV